MREFTREDAALTEHGIYASFTKGHRAHNAVEILLKGLEIALPEGVLFADKDGHIRTNTRIRWWDDQAITFKQGEPKLSDSSRLYLDYSVAKGGHLAAYQWDGETKLDPGKIVYVS